MNAVFEIGAASPAQFPVPDLPEIVFTGRSNVGKSSLLNALTGRKTLAKVSSTPGKTQQINFFRIDERMRFVDLPGYGYAKVGHEQRAHWSALIRRYFESARPIALVLQLVDARLPLQAADAAMIAWHVEHQLPLQIVMTKYDKLTQSERARQLRVLLTAIRQLGTGSTLLPFSSQSGYGRSELLHTISTAARP